MGQRGKQNDDNKSTHRSAGRGTAGKWWEQGLVGSSEAQSCKWERLWGSGEQQTWNPTGKSPRRVTREDSSTAVISFEPLNPNDLRDLYVF